MGNNVRILDDNGQVKYCNNCNPKKYLAFNFSYINHEKPNEPIKQDVIKLWQRMRWMSSGTIYEMVHDYGTDKSKWFETIPINQISKRIPDKFREDFPTETNEKYSVMRVYPAGTPAGSANPRIIWMLKHSIFYVFFLDWKGELYNHGR